MFRMWSARIYRSRGTTTAVHRHATCSLRLGRIAGELTLVPSSKLPRHSRVAGPNSRRLAKTAFSYRSSSRINRTASAETVAGSDGCAVRLVDHLRHIKRHVNECRFGGQTSVARSNGAPSRASHCTSRCRHERTLRWNAAAPQLHGPIGQRQLAAVRHWPLFDQRPILIGRLAA